MLSSSLVPTSPILTGKNGKPLRRPGRPPKAAKADMQQEYARGGTGSIFAGVNTTQDYYRLSGNVDDIDIRLGCDEKMKMNNDAECNASLSVLALGATSRPAEVEPAKKALYHADSDEDLAVELASFIRRCLLYLAGSQRDINLLMFQIIYEALMIGNAKAEIVLRKMDSGPDAGKMVLDRIKSKSRNNSCYIVDRYGNIAGIAAYTGNYANYKDPYSLPQMGITGMLQGSLLGPGWEVLPRDKWLVITNRPPGDDSPLGHSAFRPAYTPYRCKRDVLPMYLKSLDSTATPFIFATTPDIKSGNAGPTYPLKADGTEDIDAPKVPIVTSMGQAIEQGRQGGYAVVPFSADAKILYNAQSGDPFLNAFGFFNGEIRQAILLQALATGTDKHMARAAGQVHQDILDTAIRNVRRYMTDALNRDVVEMLVRTNFDQRYWHLMPTITFGDVELTDFAAWAEAFAKLMTAGLLLPSQLPHIWAIMGIPQADQKELERMLKVDAALDEQLLAPVPTATGEAGPSQAATYAGQELGKQLSRGGARKRSARLGGVVAGQ